MTNDLTIEERVTLEESLALEDELTYGPGAGEMEIPAVRARAYEEAGVRDATREKSRLSAAEKVMFAGAAVFASTMLLVGVLLTISGFIFSAATETIAFGMLTGAFGLTLYVIWRGGR